MVLSDLYHIPITLHMDNQSLLADISSTVILTLITAIMDKRKKDADDFILKVLHVHLVSVAIGSLIVHQWYVFPMSLYQSIAVESSV